MPAKNGGYRQGNALKLNLFDAGSGIFQATRADGIRRLWSRRCWVDRPQANMCKNESAPLISGAIRCESILLYSHASNKVSTKDCKLQFF